MVIRAPLTIGFFEMVAQVQVAKAHGIEHVMSGPLQGAIEDTVGFEFVDGGSLAFEGVDRGTDAGGLGAHAQVVQRAKRGGRFEFRLHDEVCAGTPGEMHEPLYTIRRGVSGVIRGEQAIGKAFVDTPQAHHAIDRLLS